MGGTFSGVAVALFAGCGIDFFMTVGLGVQHENFEVGPNFVGVGFVLPFLQFVKVLSVVEKGIMRFVKNLLVGNGRVAGVSNFGAILDQLDNVFKG